MEGDESLLAEDEADPQEEEYEEEEYEALLAEDEILPVDDAALREDGSALQDDAVLGDEWGRDVDGDGGAGGAEVEPCSVGTERNCC